MAFKIIALFALVTVARAGVIGLESRPAYSDATAVSYSSLSSPIDSHAAAPFVGRPPAYAAPAYRSPSLVHSDPVAAPAIRLAAPTSYAAPLARHHEVEEYAPAHYAFGYEVNNPHTGDVHSQQETREGDVVKGSYSLIEADGSRRVVEYTVDAHSGFNAVVHKEASAGHAKAVPAVVRPVAYAAPQSIHSYAAPQSVHAYAAPQSVHAYAAPQSVHAYAAPQSVHSYAAPQPAHSYASPALVKLGAPAVAKKSYSAAPAVSYSSVSAPAAHADAPSYYH